MLLLFDLTLPLNNPVLIFSVVLFVFLVVPIFLNKLKIPGLIGLILAGVLIGPHGLNVLERSNSIILFGTVGLLYIMFLAALELDMNEFRKNRNRSIIFGTLTFLIPISIGTFVFHYIFNYELPASVLVASMFSSHTLVSYPITSKLGISKNEAVTIAVGGTIIADTTVLLILAGITGAAEGQLSYYFWIRLVISLIVFLFVIFYVFPKIGSWFFRNIKGDNISQFTFVLAMVFTAAFLAELAGVEPIIGAFLAGLSLNKLIPHTSALMNRIEFVGNALFIPFFLISVGMMIDLKVIFTGPETIVIAGTLISLSVISKYAAAYISQRLFKYSPKQGRLLYGLSGSHAAATLAVVLVGFRLELVSESVLNATVLLILATCLISSFVVQNTGRKLALTQSLAKPELSDVPERILVPIANPANIEHLMDLAIMLKDRSSGTPIYPLAVVKDDDEAKEGILSSNMMLEKAVKQASATDDIVQIVTRVDWSISSGILRAIKELVITEVVIGWNGKMSAKDRIFGSILDTLLQKSDQMFFVSRILSPLNIIERIVVFLPEYAEYERGFTQWLSKVKLLTKQIGANIHFITFKSSESRIKSFHDQLKPVTTATYEVFDDWDKFSSLSEKIKEDELFIIVSSREGTISYNSHLDKIPNHLSRDFEDKNFIILYPGHVI